jgi:preprotein translocase subunit SecB
VDTYEYYKLIRNSVQLFDAELVSMNCINRKDQNQDGEVNVPIVLQREVKIVEDDRAEIYLRAQVGSEEAPFYFDIVYKGVCVAFTDLDKNQFEQYAYDQVVPLLLPYTRECVSSTMARMDLPIFTIPTMDILDSMEANSHPQGDQE